MSTILARQRMAGVICASAAAIGFSAKAIMVKLAYVEAVDAVTLLTLRMAFALPFFLWVAVRESRKREHSPLTTQDKIAVVALGFTGYYLASYLDFLGLQYISAGLERLILFLYPTLVVLISIVVFNKRAGRMTWIALLASYAGIALAYLHDVQLLRHDTLTGAVLVFGSALAYAIYLVGAGHSIARMGATRFTAYALTVSCMVCLVQFAATHSLSDLRLSYRVYGLGVAMAVFSTVLPTFLLAEAMRRIGSMHTSLIGSLGPVATILLAYVFLGEQMSLVQMAGSALVLAGVLLISRNKG